MSRGAVISWAAELGSALPSPLDGHFALDANELWYSRAELSAAQAAACQEALLDRMKQAAEAAAMRVPAAREAALREAKSSGDLVLYNNQLKDEELVPLLDELRSGLDGGAVRLTSIDLRSNALGDVGACALAVLLKASTCAIETLKLWSNRIGGPGVCAIASALEQNQSLTALDLGRQQPDPSSLIDGGFGSTAACPAQDVGDGMARSLAAALQLTGRGICSRLSTLDLRYLGITDSGAVELAGLLAVSKRTALCRLDLRNNSIGPAGLRALAVSMASAEASPVLRVDATKNAYVDRDAAALADEMDADEKLAALAAEERLSF